MDPHRDDHLSGLVGGNIINARSSKSCPVTPLLRPSEGNDFSVGSKVTLLPSEEMHELYEPFVGREGIILSISQTNDDVNYAVQISNRIISLHQCSIEQSIFSLNQKNIPIKSNIFIQNFSKGCKVKILPGANRSHIDEIGQIIDQPIHPNTWYKVRFQDSSEIMYRPSALTVVDDETNSFSFQNISNYSINPKDNESSNGFKLGSRIVINDSQISLKRVHDYIGYDGEIIGVPIHPNTWYEVKLDCLDHIVKIQGPCMSLLEDNSNVPTINTKKVKNEGTLDKYLGFLVYIKNGKEMGSHGYILKTGNGWVQIRLKDRSVEIAKRIYDVNIISEPNELDSSFVGQTISIIKGSNHNKQGVVIKITDQYYVIQLVDSSTVMCLPNEVVPQFRQQNKVNNRNIEAKPSYKPNNLHNDSRDLFKNKSTNHSSNLCNNYNNSNQFVSGNSINSIHPDDGPVIRNVYQEKKCPLCTYPCQNYCWNSHCKRSPIYNNKRKCADDSNIPPPKKMSLNLDTQCNINNINNQIDKTNQGGANKRYHNKLEPPLRDLFIALSEEIGEF